MGGEGRERGGGGEGEGEWVHTRTACVGMLRVCVWNGSALPQGVPLSPLEEVQWQEALETSQAEL